VPFPTEVKTLTGIEAIDLGTEGGGECGQIVVAGTPETVAAHPTSYTGRYLKKVLDKV
jgi:excinuclease ABC subunit A